MPIKKPKLAQRPSGSSMDYLRTIGSFTRSVSESRVGEKVSIPHLYTPISRPSHRASFSQANPPRSPHPSIHLPSKPTKSTNPINPETPQIPHPLPPLLPLLPGPLSPHRHTPAKDTAPPAPTIQTHLTERHAPPLIAASAGGTAQHHDIAPATAGRPGGERERVDRDGWDRFGSTDGGGEIAGGEGGGGAAGDGGGEGRAAGESRGECGEVGGGDV